MRTVALQTFSSQIASVPQMLGHLAWFQKAKIQNPSVMAYHRFRLVVQIAAKCVEGLLAAIVLVVARVVVIEPLLDLDEVVLTMSDRLAVCLTIASSTYLLQWLLPQLPQQAPPQRPPL